MLKIHKNKNNVDVRTCLFQTNKGITLIALIITIIIMLILVGVTITIAVNGGLFEYAGRAGKETNEAIKNEQKIANGQMIDKYANKGTTVTFYIRVSSSEEPYYVDQEYTVNTGTTWEEFLKKYTIYDYGGEYEVFSSPPNIFEDDSSFMGYPVPAGAILVSGGAPVFEGSDIGDCLWAKITDPLKDGVIYNCER